MKKKYVISKKNSKKSNSSQEESSNKPMLDKSPSPKLLQTPKSQEPIPFSQIAGEIKAENPPKKGPGRPKKNVSSLDAQVGQSNSEGALTTPTTSINSNAPSNVPPELIGMTLVQASALAAGIWHNPGYVIEEAQSLEDGKSLKPAVDALLDKWLPHVGPWALELTFAGAIAAIVFRQYKNGQKLSNDQPG